MTDWHHDAARGLVRRPSQSTPSSPVLRPVRAPSPAPAHRPASSGARSPSPAGSRRISWASNNAGGGLLTGTVSLNDSFGLPTRPARPVSGRASSPGPRLGVPGGTGGGGGRGLVHARMASAPQISAGFEGGWGGEGWSGASALAPLSRDWGEVERYVADLERQNAALRAQLDQAVKEGYVWHVAYSHSLPGSRVPSPAHSPHGAQAQSPRPSPRQSPLNPGRDLPAMAPVDGARMFGSPAVVGGGSWSNYTITATHSGAPALGPRRRSAVFD